MSKTVLSGPSGGFSVGVAQVGLSFRSNFAWMFSGNVVYAICQWGMVVALAKLGSSVMLGQFSLGLAIATPVLMLTNLNLRAVQATDATHSYTFHEYLQLRVTMTIAALLVIGGLVWGGRYEQSTSIVILGVATAKGIETLSDIHYGLFQQHDRLDQTGMSMILRGALSVLALSGALFAAKNVLWGCVSVSSVWFLTLLFYDSTRARRILGAGTIPSEPQTANRFSRQWRLLRLALPLGVVTTLASVNLNIPRYYVFARMGEHQLGIFSAIAYTTVAITLISDSLSHASIPRMSRLYVEGRIREFRLTLFRLIAICLVLGLGALAVTHFAGNRLLAILYSREYANHAGVFTLLVLATGINCVASMLTTGITSARRFGIQIPLFALAALSCVAGCTLWLPSKGLIGGAEATVFSAAVRLILSLLVIWYLLTAGAGSSARRMTSRYCGGGSSAPTI